MDDRAGAQVAWVSDALRPLAASLIELQLNILDDARRRLAADSTFAMAQPARVGAGDISFELDLPAEDLIESHFAHAPQLWPITVVAEGLGLRTFGAASERVPWRIVLDPIDGTRELALTKRSAWSLAGVAVDRGPETSLRDIVLAIQTELPPPKQRLASVVLAERDQGVREALWDCVEARFVTLPRNVRSSDARSIRGGVASIVHFFPGLHRVMGEASDRLYREVLGVPGPGDAQVIDDQYCSTGGQIYLLATGRYRLVADLRGIVPSATRGLTAHPYDLGTYLIAQEAGATVTDPFGAALDYHIDTSTACSWIGYANPSILHEVEGKLRSEVAWLVASEADQD
jgi:fructose-1,6-bisphosphatase/inositol monophosphatase family enzyme